MHTKLRLTAGVAVIVVAAVLPAASIAGQPVIRDHESIVDGPNPTTWCGQVGGTQVDTGTFTFRQDASGVVHATEHFQSVFTATSTGRSLEIEASGLDMGTGVDNGDGTTTFTEHSAGLVIRFKIPNGPVLSRDAGFVSFNDTFDATTGEFLGETISPENGPHPDLDSGFALFCDVLVPYLQDP